MYLQKQFQVNQNLRTSFELGELPCGHMLRWRQLLLKSCLGTSLVVQGVRFCLPMQGMQVQSLVGELRSTCLLAKKQNLKQKQYYNKFNKDLKKKQSSLRLSLRTFTEVQLALGEPWVCPCCALFIYCWWRQWWLIAENRSKLRLADVVCSWSTSAPPSSFLHSLSLSRRSLFLQVISAVECLKSRLTWHGQLWRLSLSPKAEFLKRELVYNDKTPVTLVLTMVRGSLQFWLRIKCQNNFSYLISYLIRSVIGEGNGTPLQYSCLENPMGGGAW